MTLLRYAVKVMEIGPHEEAKEEGMNWAQLQYTNRLNEHVAKGLVLCYVQRPPSFNPLHLPDFSLLPLHTISEVVVQRFVQR